MKKIRILIVVIISMIMWAIPLDAASFGMTSSTKNVKPNGTFTINVGGDCTGRVNLTISNGTLSSSSVWVEDGYTSVTVTAGSNGTVTITATPETGFSDADANIYNPGSRTVTVNISSGSSSSSGSSKPATPKSSDNNLSSITISSGELSPSFDKNQTEYKINLSGDTTKITIDAKVSDSKAKIEGLGEHNVNPGNNNIEIVVTAENGEKKIYKINAYVDETPEVYLGYLKEKIGIVRNYEGVQIPENFTKGEHTIDGKNISMFTNNKLNIIYGINELNEKNFYLFDTVENEIINKIMVVNINNKVLYVINDNSKKDKVTINELEVSCEKLSNIDSYCILKTINNEEKYDDYIYETTENGLIKFNDELIKIEKFNTKNIILYIISALLILSISFIVYLIYKLKKGGTNEKTN